MHYDLIIVGGGLVGRTLACALRLTSLNIALIDANPVERFDPRLIALNYGSAAFLEKLGLWSALEKYSAPIHEVQVSQRGHFGATRLKATDVDLPALGYVVKAQQINSALSLSLEKSAPGQFTELRPATVKEIKLSAEKATLVLESQGTESQLTAELILAADGTDSTIRKLLQFETQNQDYEQSALVTTTKLTRPHGNRAYERFLPHGETLAMLPLKEEAEGDLSCATIWTAKTEAISALKALSAEVFLQKLQEAFGYRLGRLCSITERYVFPLHFIKVKQPVQNQVVLIGNAAHTIHPIAAQGLNLALYEIANLSDLLSKRVEQKQSLSAGLAAELLKLQPQANLLFSHYLSQLFGAELLGLSFARQLGMIGLDLCRPLKKRLTRLLAMEKLKWL